MPICEVKLPVLLPHGASRQRRASLAKASESWSERMKVELRLYASLSRYMPERWKGSSMVEIPEGITVKELLQSAEVPIGAVKVIFINGLHGGVDDVLHDNDRVGVFPPVAGG